MARLSLIVIAILSLSIISGCGSSKKVTRISEQSVTDLSGDWNDTDSRLVSEAMISDVVRQPWLGNFTNKTGRQPVLIVGKITNRSYEHINVNTFVKDIERQLINSGDVEFVASSTERDQIRDERKDQAVHAAEETQKAPGQESGADFMIIGTISSIIDKEGGTQVKFYQINMELISLVDNKKVWIGEKKIKKGISKSSVKF
ncbi:MAG: penicillin-binding protein activator LpoB [Chlorobiales bacterium]|nr:penicillin-binding protein activator LpoB [Chlorobiales bacterium]